MPQLRQAAEDGPVVVSVIEDHPLFRQAVVELVTAADGFELGVVAGDVAEFVARCTTPEGVVLLDLGLPGLSGVDAVKRLVDDGHRVLIVTASERSHDMLATLDAGASGYIGKLASSDEIAAAIRRVSQNERYVAPDLAAK
ncbi:MAG: hypothetical protein RI885_961, partial [Actinomycetota bacterium]